MQFTGDGYHKASNEHAQESGMLINFNFTGGLEMPVFTVLLSENKGFGWQNMKSLEDRESTRAENYIKLTGEEAKQLAEWILRYLAFSKE